MTIESYAWQSKLVALVDGATDDILAGVAKDLVTCGIKGCKICPLTQQILNLVRELRDARNAEAAK